MEWFGIRYYDKFGNLITWSELEYFYNENHFWYGSVSIRLQSWYFMSIWVSYMSLFLSLATVLDL